MNSTYCTICDLEGNHYACLCGVCGELVYFCNLCMPEEVDLKYFYYEDQLLHIHQQKYHIPVNFV